MSYGRDTTESCFGNRSQPYCNPEPQHSLRVWRENESKGDNRPGRTRCCSKPTFNTTHTLLVGLTEWLCVCLQSSSTRVRVSHPTHYEPPEGEKRRKAGRKKVSSQTGRKWKVTLQTQRRVEILFRNRSASKSRQLKGGRGLRLTRFDAEVCEQVRT